jgi:CubicO group peptidase (beta-lactamase class C family)
MKIFNLIILLLFLFSNIIYSNEYYFPPIDSKEWDTISPKSLNWNIEKIYELYNFLESKNSKAFILLKNGKIVLEKYFGSFTADSNWYWASAGKTLTAALIGIVQYDGLLSIEDKTSKYLGEGWTSMPLSKENLIKIRHQLTMTTGLDYKVDDLDCTKPECLQYRSDAGTQWYYHNAAYTLLEKVVEKSSNTNYNLYFNQKIKNQIGMNGIWIKVGYNNIYFSTARSMARYGILIANNGYWEKKDVIKDKEYIKQMINTSQELNKSYGYLWWLNGKESSMLPGSTLVFNRMLMLDAPKDVYAALGKDGQCLNISPQNNLIWVRMGEKPDDQFFISTNLCNDIWKYINELTNITDIEYYDYENNILYPNPATDKLYLKLTNNLSIDNIKTYNYYGKLIEIIDIKNINHKDNVLTINLSSYSPGLYIINVGNTNYKFIKN